MSDSITDQQRQALHEALDRVESRGDRVSVSALRAEAGVRQNVASAFLAEVRERRASQTAAPELPTDPEVVNAIVAASYPAAYAAARAVVADELAAARELVDTYDNARAQAEDEADDARTERDQAVAAQQAAEAERDEALTEATSAAQRAEEAEQARRDAEARADATQTLVDGLQAQLDALTAAVRALSPGSEQG